MALPNMVPEQDLRQHQSGRAGNRKLRPGFNVQHPRRAHRHQDRGSRADVELLGWPVRLPVVRNIRRGAGGEPVPAPVQRNLARSRLRRRPVTLNSPEIPPAVDPSSAGLARVWRRLISLSCARMNWRSTCYQRCYQTERIWQNEGNVRWLEQAELV